MVERLLKLYLYNFIRGRDMKLKKNKKWKILGISSLFLLGLFLYPGFVQADLALPTSVCNDEQVDAILPGFGISAHITSDMDKENGATAFTYGNDNNSFVTVSDSIITLYPNLLFDPNTNPGSFMKLHAFSTSCTLVFGFGPISGTDGDVPLQFGANTVSYDSSTDLVRFNDGIAQRVRPNLVPRYIWLEAWDGKNTPDKLATYSYLIDLQNPQNPTGTVGGPPPEPPGKRPVLIIPGIMGTELLDENDELIWPNITRMLFDINDQFLTDNLSLASNGVSIENVAIENIIDRIQVQVSGITIANIDIFFSLVEKIETQGYINGQTYFIFPYDWRLDLNTSQEELNNYIEQIKSSTGFNKVDIIAHSMGGLLTEGYVNNNGSSSVNKLIFVGTPHLGAPKSGKVLLHGDRYGIPVLEEDRIQEIAVNSPSVYQLLPSPEYFNSFSGYIAPFSFFGPNLLDYQSTKQFLIDKGANSSLLDRADDFFAQNLNTQDFGDIQVHNIVGCRTATQAAYGYGPGNNFIGKVVYTSGDGTVPFISADSVNADVKYYVKNGEHASLPSRDNVRQLIVNILDDSNVLPTEVSHNTGFCNLNGKTLIWRSPVEIHVYDQDGNHAGPIPGGFENNLPGVDYEIIDGEKFIFIPTDDGNTYTVTGLGEEEGTFDLVISEVDNGEVISATIYNDIPITSLSEVEVDTNNQVSIDSDGNGSFEVLEASSILTGDAINDLTPPVTEIAIDGTLSDNDWYTGDVTITLQAVDEGSGVLETRYSIDGGETFVLYEGAFVLADEGVTELQFYSVDLAGNNEEINILELKIDKTSPEFSIEFDLENEEFVFLINDNLDLATTVVCVPTSCLAQDEAGNTTNLEFEDKIKKHSQKLQLISLSYNGKSALSFPDNSFGVQFKEKKDELKQFTQTINIKKQERAKINYKLKKDQSVVTLKQKDEKRIKEKLEGLQFLQLTTNQGELDVNIK
jgi:pimeloyl-ACP methyl ester carboxylesterase